MNNNNIFDIISRSLSGEASDDEITFLLQWCAQSEENKKEYMEFKKAWILSDRNIDKKVKASKVHIWNSIIDYIPVKTSQRYSKRILIYCCSISAAVAILIMLGFNFFRGRGGIFDEPQFTYMYMPKGEKGQLFLPDGTKVWLNSDTKVTLSNQFNVENRIVYLEGEAYFDVTKDEENKFIVRVDHLDVMVHGTTFKVAAYSESPDIKVSLQEGLVSILENNTNKILTELKPNQEVSINKNTRFLDRHTFDPDNYISWTFDELIFDYSSTDEVFSKMENWYGVNIKVVSPKENLRYRFRIKTETLTEILELMNKMTPLKYHINGKEVTIIYK
ncbi:FecR family protein [Dysgonomonas sp. Marseille-P4677]|uniref:FecR family protein n=1 Tax=Dysgonomonas sp. Marseille-P4677 TaxID=2364790 RepID=UPI001913C053|nr:FecR family protein [Dysgonomonas sp. Marseille-P4677]MBK5720084.1 FecR family protein [Dysgonomonas sp. Marseille-P4677]